MAELAGQARVPEHVIGRGLGLGQGVGVVGHAQKAEAGDDRIQPVAVPMAGEFLELREEFVEGVIRGVQGLDIAGRVQLLDIFGIRQDHVEGARRGLRDQAQHVVAAGIVFRHELDVVGGLEFGHHVGFGMAVPGQHGQFRGRRKGAPRQHRRGQRRRPQRQGGAPRQAGTGPVNPSHLITLSGLSFVLRLRLGERGADPKSVLPMRPFAGVIGQAGAAWMPDPTRSRSATRSLTSDSPAADSRGCL